MNPVSSLVLSLALLLGAVGGVYAYDSAAHSTPAHSTVTTASAAGADTATQDASRQARHRARHRTVVRWAPCPDGSRLERGVCVTDVVSTVTLPAPAAPVAAHGTGGAAASHGSGDDHGAEHDDGGHGGEHGGEGGGEGDG